MQNIKVNESYYENDEIMASFARSVLDMYVGYANRYNYEFKKEYQVATIGERLRMELYNHQLVFDIEENDENQENETN